MTAGLTETTTPLAGQVAYLAEVVDDCLEQPHMGSFVRYITSGTTEVKIELYSDGAVRRMTVRDRNRLDPNLEETVVGACVHFDAQNVSKLVSGTGYEVNFRFILGDPGVSLDRVEGILRDLLTPPVLAVTVYKRERGENPQSFTGRFDYSEFYRGFVPKS
jgi:hypothetical protein